MIEVHYEQSSFTIFHERTSTSAPQLFQELLEPLYPSTELSSMTPASPMLSSNQVIIQCVYFYQIASFRISRDFLSKRKNNWILNIITLILFPFRHNLHINVVEQSNHIQRHVAYCSINTECPYNKFDFSFTTLQLAAFPLISQRYSKSF